MPRDKVLHVDNRVRVNLGRQDGTPFPPVDGAGLVPALAIIVEHLGAGQRAGWFDIDGLNSLNPGRAVLVFHVPAPVATKGGARDEIEFDHVQASGVVLDPTRIRVWWSAPSIIVGDVAFAYGVSQ